MKRSLLFLILLCLSTQASTDTHRIAPFKISLDYQGFSLIGMQSNGQQNMLIVQNGKEIELPKHAFGDIHIHLASLRSQTNYDNSLIIIIAKYGDPFSRDGHGEVRFELKHGQFLGRYRSHQINKTKVNYFMTAAGKETQAGK